MNTYYDKDIAAVYEAMSSSAKGLSTLEATGRLIHYGKNEIADKRKNPAWKLLLNQFANFMSLVLIGTAIISGLLGEVTDTIIIAAIIILNAIVGFIQEYRAGKALEALKKMSGNESLVFRDNTIQTVPSTTLVPGDIIFLETGNIVPADIRLIQAEQLVVDESSLTGESLAIYKNIKALPDSVLSPGDQHNMAFKGTYVIKGRGKGLVVYIGMQTEQGKIAGLLQQPAIATPLQKTLAIFGRTLVYIVLAICVLIFIAGYLRGENALLMLMTVLSLAVAVIPEALPAVITISLALGARKMIRQNALIKKLSAIETLGSVTYICTDKTGTLTYNKMTVEKIVGEAYTSITEQQDAAPDNQYTWMMRCMALNSDAYIKGHGNISGDPMEVALSEFALAANYNKPDLERLYPRIAEIPFDPERKCMTTVHRNGGRYIAFVKGAMDVLISAATTGTDLTIWNERTNRMSAEGLRVLGFAIKEFTELPAVIGPLILERDLHILGIAGIIDPARNEVAGAIEECHNAGIETIMITGDHVLTAATIAKRLGIIRDREDVILTGKELSYMSKVELQEKAPRIKVYARVSPGQKLDIIKALQSKGAIVAMTGDGVNDAPALKHADIGIAMGINGTDIAREAASMVLLDDNFATIAVAVREGRKIYDNIRKFIRYVLTGNMAELLTILVAPFIGLPVPLLPIHILWINLVTDGLPGIALAEEPAEPDVMQRPPRNPSQGVLSAGLGIHVAWVGLLLAGLTIGTQAYNIHIGNTHGQTMVFTVLCLGQLMHVLSIRSEYRSLFHLGLASNKPLLVTVLVTFCLQLLIIYLPVLNKIFKTQPLSLKEMVTCILISFVVLLAVEIEKWIRRRRRAGRLAAIPAEHKNITL